MKTIQIFSGCPDVDRSVILKSVFPGMPENDITTEEEYLFLKVENPDAAIKELRKYCFRICSVYSVQ